VNGNFLYIIKNSQKHSMGTKLTTNDFIKRANKVHNNKYDYSLAKYTGAQTMMMILLKN